MRAGGGDPAVARDRPDPGRRLPICTGVDTTTLLQSVRWKPLPEVAGTGVQEATTVGPLKSVSGGHWISIQLLPAAAVCGVHEATAALVVLLVEQVVSV